MSKLNLKNLLHESNISVKLPDAELETPVSVSEPSEEIKTNAYASMLNAEIQAVWNAIDSLKSDIATISNEEPMEHQEDILAILNSLIDSRNVEIGMLTKALELVDGSTQELVAQGVEKAEDIIYDNKEASTEK